MKKIEKKELLSIPNLMGYFRIVLIPVFAVVYIRADSLKDYYIAAAIVLVSTITDLLDGQVARHFHMITEFGKFLDPLADKLTHGVIALCLIFRFRAMKYLVLLMIFKEGFMAVMGLVHLRHGRKLDGAKWFGKVCTASLFLVLTVLVFLPQLPLSIANALIYAEIGIMAATLLLYIPEFIQMKKSWET